MSYQHVQVDGNNRVVGVSMLRDEESRPNLYRTDIEARPGQIYDPQTDTVTEPPQPPRLEITLDKSQATPGETVTGTVEVRDGDDNLVDISGTYHVPVLDIDDRKAMMLKVTLSGGQGTESFSFPETGIYTLRTDLIRPVPSARLAQSPELIVSD